MIKIPAEFDRVRELAQRAVFPLVPVDDATIAKRDFLFSGKRAVSGPDLPAPYFIYFLFVELLRFKDLGRFEKLAWSIPVDFNGKAFLIEHRKMGVGIFIQDDADTDAAKRIAVLIKKGVRCAQPYFKWKAEQAVAASQINVTNNSRVLFDRYEYLVTRTMAVRDEAERRKDEVVRTQLSPTSWSSSRPAFQSNREARWLAMAAVDAFFSWTEHVFIHIAILDGKITSGQDFTALSGAEWGEKFKSALDISDVDTKKHFDKLTILRRQLRNFVAHGAFGKDGETLHFHSSAGAVPVLFDVTRSNGFVIGQSLEFQIDGAFQAMTAFITFLWEEPRKPAWLYIQEYGLPLIMTMARDGTYRRAMASLEDMEGFADHLAGQMDNAANMDW
jgi:hypothetical protein